MADCERGLGRPERALTMAGAPEVERLDRAGKVEMRIVASGARRDLGQLDAAIVTLQCQELKAADRTSWSARLKFAYADALLAADRTEEAREWFERAQQADADDETDAAERLAELDGIVWIDAEDDDDDDDDDDAAEDGAQGDDVQAYVSAEAGADDADDEGDDAQTYGSAEADDADDDAVAHGSDAADGEAVWDDNEDEDDVVDVDDESAAEQGNTNVGDAATSLRFEAPAIAAEPLDPEPLDPGVTIPGDRSNMGDDLP
jgi:hypothetical protein